METHDLLMETWGILQEYIPAKERQLAADQLISHLHDTGTSEEDLILLRGEDKSIDHALDFLGIQEEPIEDWDE